MENTIIILTDAQLEAASTDRSQKINNKWIGQHKNADGEWVLNCERCGVEFHTPCPDEDCLMFWTTCPECRALTALPALAEKDWSTWTPEARQELKDDMILLAQRVSKRMVDALKFEEAIALLEAIKKI